MSAKRIAPPEGRRSGSDVETFAVKLMRPIFQTAVVLVEAKDEKQAVARALRTARGVPEEDWEGGFDRKNYAITLQHVLNAAQAVDERGWSPSEEAEVALAAELASWDDIRYLVLKADIESGEGETHAQPWLRKISNLMVADLGMDWAEQLEPVQHKGIDGYREMWGAVPRPEPRERRENVVPFRKAQDEDDDSEDEPA